MPRQTLHAKDETFNFRVDPALKAQFQAATEAEDKAAAQVLREFMRGYVVRHRQRDLAAEARRQSLTIAARSSRANSDETAVVQEMDSHLAELGDEWK